MVGFGSDNYQDRQKQRQVFLFFFIYFFLSPVNFWKETERRSLAIFIKNESSLSNFYFHGDHGWGV